ncbi:unnamed protein product [Rotaria magnacalcarata]|uniref:Uncharacterized protein n=1 Tax=Rotaria magnacalcarata TaxID=392030 RepID=A0A816U747_9BILA|nr:unnamed protein product [Rotaria magnacalcarata]CAF4006921.1 unnamed protein product [Rotaria magnacalcarata]
MSAEELIRKFYHGSYKINSHGYFACPLYDDKIREDDQICKFFVRNEGRTLSEEEFKHFWSHVSLVHENMYQNILEMCRSKISTISKIDQFEKTFDVIASSFGTLNKLASAWSNTNMTSVEFMGKFKSELESLEKQKKLPKLKYFSLTVPSFTCYYDIQIVLLLCRMINLEELKLYLSVTRFNSTYVDGKFTFCINTEVFNEKVRVELSSNEDIQRSFIGRGYQQVTSYVDTNSMKTEGYCFLYSVPYDFEDFVQHNNSYQGGMFQKVRQLTMYNKIPFELFKLISEDFPFLQFLYISNGHPQQDKSHSSTLITFPYLTFLNLKYAHVDYAELFLLKNNVHLPRLLDLRIEYQ